MVGQMKKMMRKGTRSMMKYVRSATLKVEPSHSWLGQKWSLARPSLLASILLLQLAAIAFPQSGESLFADPRTVRLEASVEPHKVLPQDRILVRYQIRNLGQSSLLASDSDLAGAYLRLVVRDKDGKEIPDSMSSDASFYGKLTPAQKLARFWFVIPRDHFAGNEFEVYRGGPPKMKAGERYAVSVLLTVDPDPAITKADIETVAPESTRLLRGKFESEPVWVTAERP